jgi:hypothetical protein
MNTDGSRGGPDLLEIEEATSFTVKKAKKPSIVCVTRWSSVVNAVVVALIMMMPPVLLIFSGHLDDPAVWIKSAVAGLGARRGNCNWEWSPSASKRHWFTSIGELA